MDKLVRNVAKTAHIRTATSLIKLTYFLAVHVSMERQVEYEHILSRERIDCGLEIICRVATFIFTNSFSG
jgi:hypothetical protein